MSNAAILSYYNVLIKFKYDQIGRAEVTHFLVDIFRFDNWDENQPSGNGECMGYSAEHNYEWDDFQCNNYVTEDWRVSYLCEG